MKGDVVTEADNPGLRVEPNFIDEAEEEQLAQELRAYVDKYGFCFDVEKVSVQLVDSNGRNARRVWQESVQASDRPT